MIDVYLINQQKFNIFCRVSSMVTNTLSLKTAFNVDPNKLHYGFGHIDFTFARHNFNKCFQLQLSHRFIISYICVQKFSTEVVKKCPDLWFLRGTVMLIVIFAVWLKQGIYLFFVPLSLSLVLQVCSDNTVHEIISQCNRLDECNCDCEELAIHRMCIRPPIA